MKQKIILEVTREKVKLRVWRNGRLRCWNGIFPAVGLQINETHAATENEICGRPTPLKPKFPETGHFECNFEIVKCVEYDPRPRKSLKH